MEGFPFVQIKWVGVKLMLFPAEQNRSLGHNSSHGQVKVIILGQTSSIGYEKRENLGSNKKT